MQLCKRDVAASSTELLNLLVLHQALHYATRNPVLGMHVIFFTPRKNAAVESILMQGSPLFARRLSQLSNGPS